MMRPLRRKKEVPRPERSAPRRGGGSLRALAPLASWIWLLAVVGAAVVGLERLKTRVYARPEFNPPLKVELDEPPAWVLREGWAPRIVSAICLDEDHRWSDDRLLREVHDQMLQSGWVSSVRRVSRGMDGTIRVACDYRRPIAMVATRLDGRDVYVAVDREGVRLPEVYGKVGDDSGWMRIMGVRGPLPELGQRYRREAEGGHADDAVAAVRLAALLFDHEEIATQVGAIDMSNFRGRCDRKKDRIELWTRGGGRIHWGSAIGEEIEEPEAADKVRNILLRLKHGLSGARVDVSIYSTAWVERATVGVVQ